MTAKNSFQITIGEMTVHVSKRLKYFIALKKATLHGLDFVIEDKYKI